VKSPSVAPKQKKGENFGKAAENLTMKRERERERERAVLPTLVTSVKEVSFEAAPTNEPKV
jgi:hypothetical protein